MSYEPGSRDPGGESPAARELAGERQAGTAAMAPTAAAAAPEAVSAPPVRVESGAALRAAAERWLAAPALALDTEFVRERTFFPRLGLIQVNDGEAIYLLDPLAVRDLAPLAAVCRAAGTLKVLHSASEDVEVFYHAIGVVPAPLFDTQVAAGLAGLGTSLGYQRLVAALLGLELPKGETRTDWLARPLSPRQLAYAAEDVAYLLPLYERLRQELTALGRLDWALEDSAALLDTSRLEADGGAMYRRVRGAGRLGRRQLGVLRALAAWRDGEARRRDLPRGFVLRDEVLLELAVRQPATAEELRGVSALEPQQAARDGAAWLELIREALALADDELPPEPWRPPGSAAPRELEQRLRAVVRERAAALGLPPELLAPRRAVDAVLRSALSDAEPRLPRDLGAGWRRAVVGEALLRAASVPV
jgi:ribonuclease D